MAFRILRIVIFLGLNPMANRPVSWSYRTAKTPSNPSRARWMSAIQREEGAPSMGAIPLTLKAIQLAILAWGAPPLTCSLLNISSPPRLLGNSFCQLYAKKALPAPQGWIG